MCFNFIFYAYSGIGFILFFLIFILFVYLFTKLLQILKFKKYKKTVFIVCVIITILPLIFFKYTNFIISIFSSFSGNDFTLNIISIPLGISFYTFEAVSLLADIYNNKIKNRISLFNMFFYFSFFPIIVSGPITRYDIIISEIDNKRITANNLNVGISRFVIGLSKKVIIASNLCFLSDFCFDTIKSGNTMSCFGLWVGAISYTLQIYFDFSGYSDMAIGISKVFGFEIPENFNHPYLAISVQDFWRRWHISLSRWFRDYVYIPLGGNRVSSKRHILNLLIVWCLTGIWHGANWTFIIWGLLYFVLLVFEKYSKKIARILNKGIIGHIYTLFCIIILWVIFRADSIKTAIRYLIGMIGIESIHVSVEREIIRFLPFVILSCVLCLPWLDYLSKYKNTKYYKLISGISILVLLILSISAIKNALYSPFIYGNF